MSLLFKEQQLHHYRNFYFQITFDQTRLLHWIE